MNNKGFAITGVLYTILILLLTILLVVLSALNTERKMETKVLETLEDDLYGVGIENCNMSITSACPNLDSENSIASIKGKYIFSYDDGDYCGSMYFIVGDEIKKPNDNCTKIIGIYEFKG